MEYSDNLKIAKAAAELRASGRMGRAYTRPPYDVAYMGNDEAQLLALVSIAESLEVLTEWASHLMMGHIQPVDTTDTDADHASPARCKPPENLIQE